MNVAPGRWLVRWLGLGLWLSALALPWPAAAQARFDFEATPGLLSKDVVPSHYALTLDLDPQRDGFSGQAIITVQVRKPVPAVVLHAHELQALSSELVDAAGATRALAIVPDP